MSIFLVIYRKTPDVTVEKVEDCIKEFGFDEKRQINQHSFDRLDLYTDRLWNSDNALETEDAFFLFCGNLFNGTDSLACLSQIASKDEFDFSSIHSPFSLLKYNKSTAELQLTNDKYGLYPLFVFEDEDVFVACSEFEPIALLKGVAFERDYDAVKQFFTLSTVLQNRTFVRQIQMASPACKLTVNSKGSSKKQYWTPNFKVNRNGSAKEWAAELASAFKDAVIDRATICEPTLAFLTGGLDTRLILSVLPEDLRKDILLQSSVVPDLPPQEDRDIILARRLAEKAGLKHECFQYPRFLNRIYDDEYFNDQREPYQAAVIAGLFGSELFSGKLFDCCPAIIQALAQEKKDITEKTALELYDSNRRSMVFFEFCDGYSDFRPEFAAMFGEEVDAATDDPHEVLAAELEAVNCENSELYIAIQSFSRSFFCGAYCGHIGLWLNPYSMQTQVQLPFLDFRILDTLLQIPLNILMDEKETIYNLIYKEYFPEFNDIPTSSQLGRIDGSCIDLFEGGTEPKTARRPKVKETIVGLMKDENTWSDREFDAPEVDRLSKDMRSYNFNANALGRLSPYLAWVEYVGWKNYMNNKVNGN